MESYKAIFYSITCVGFLNGKPTIYYAPDGEEQIEFFFKTILHSNALHRVFIDANAAEKLLSHGYPGAKLFLEGELINYSIITLNEKTQIIPEIFARKIWFLDPDEPEKCEHSNARNQACFLKLDGKNKKLLHYTLH